MRTAFVLSVALCAGVAGQDTSATPTSTIYALGLVGLGANGSGSSGPSQQYFAEFNLMTPVDCSGKPVEHPLQHRCWFWLNPRIASVPSDGAAALNALGSSLSSLSGGLGSQTVRQISQSLEFQAGFEFYLKSPWEGAQFGRDLSWARSAVSVIGGGGIVTPFNSAQGAPEFALNPNAAAQFNQNASLAAEFPQLAQALCGYGYAGSTCPKTPPVTVPATVAFVPPLRSRFYRDFYLGVRVRTFYLAGDCPDPSLQETSANCKLQNIFPGTFELRFGADETVTAGRLVPLVMTLAASYPLPSTNQTVRIFGSVYLRLASSRSREPLALVPSPSFATLDQPSVVVQPVPDADQDYYRLGLGVDLLPLIAKWAAH